MQRIRQILNRETRPEAPQADRIFVPRINAGMTVTHDTAMQFSAVFRAVNYIASQIAIMPWRVMTDSNGTKEIVTAHPVDRLIHRRPNPEMSPFEFREIMISWALTWGNGYAEIERDRSNRPVALWPINPERVEVGRDDDGKLVYEISNNRKGNDFIPADRIYHLHGLGYDGIVGHSVISLAARGIGLGLAAEQFGASFFQNGTVTNLKIEHPNTLGDQAYKNLRDSIQGWLRGPMKAFNPLIVEEGMKVEGLTMPMEDAQFLETRQFQVEEIARWFGLPPHKLQSLDKATFSNIEQQSIEVVTDALLPWAVRLEQEADFKLFSRPNFYTKINMNSLLRGDTAARATFYREMWNLGVFSVNEIRELEDMNPVTDGDKRFVPMNMTTLEKAGEDPEPAPLIEEGDGDDEFADAITQIANKIARRELHRVRGAADRYAADRDGFVAWMVGFFDQHRDYCIKAFLDISIESSVVITERIPDARLKMLEYYDTGAEYPVNQTATDIAGAILENAYGNAEPKRLSN